MYWLMGIIFILQEHMFSFLFFFNWSMAEYGKQLILAIYGFCDSLETEGRKCLMGLFHKGRISDHFPSCETDCKPYS